LLISIGIWIDAFINYAKVMVDRHPLLAGDLLSYMSIIRGAVVDAPFTGLINTTYTLLTLQTSPFITA
jgi:hypothetical protein